MIQTAKITAILVFENKKQVDHSKHRNKKEAKNVMVWFLKKTYEKRKIHCSDGFCRIPKFIKMKTVVILVKVDEMYNILKSVLGIV